MAVPAFRIWRSSNQVSSTRPADHRFGRGRGVLQITLQLGRRHKVPEPFQLYSLRFHDQPFDGAARSELRLKFHMGTYPARWAALRGAAAFSECNLDVFGWLRIEAGVAGRTGLMYSQGHPPTMTSTVLGRAVRTRRSGRRAIAVNDGEMAVVAVM